MSKIIDIITSPENGYSNDLLEAYLRKYNHLNNEYGAFRLLKRSIDARSRQIKAQLRVQLFLKGELVNDLEWSKSRLNQVDNQQEVIIVGAGPAGYFCALRCIELNLKPIILERGKDVRDRRRDLANINKKNIVNPDSNYCFGEGGAGTYSDGKLYTRSKKRGSVNKVLEMLVSHGATSEILVDAHPHIGTNKLPKVIAEIRESIEQAGGEIHFNTTVVGFEKQSNKITQIKTSKGTYKSRYVVLATGHSARDIYQLLHNEGVKIEAKPFALGVRIEHHQSLIDKIQYKTTDRGRLLPAASYALKHNVSYHQNMEGVFSFCMCPGGFIVPAATAQEEVVVNGMSPSKRDSKYANSGIVVSIDQHDFKPFQKFDELAGLAYQSSVERRNFNLAGKTQQASAQRMVDFVNGKVSSDLPECSYQPGLTSVDLREVLPQKVSKVLKAGFETFGKKMKGYLTNDAVLVGVESRTSSPVKIPRDRDTLQHPEMANLFPCGEGAGFAGGIVSAAIDGMNCADAIGIHITNNS